MKKFIILTVVTISLMSLVNIMAGAARESVTKVDVTVASSTMQRKLISCNGTVKEKNTVETTVDFPVYYEEVLIKEGDSVKAGDTIAIVDTEKTVSLLKKLDSDNLTEILENFGITQKVISILNGESEMLSDYSQVIEKIETSSADIIAPCDGTVVASNITGKTLMTSQSSVTISNRNEMTVETYIPEVRINEIKVGQVAYITCTALENETFTGVVSSISPNSGNNGVKVIIDIDNAENKLKYGFEAKGSIVTKTYADAITVPYESIIYDGDSAYVYVALDNRAYKKQITVLTESLDGCAVTGIYCGDCVITNCQELVDGQSIKIKSITE